MKKKYISPMIEMTKVDEENDLLTSSPTNWGNNVIPTGEEEEEGGSLAKEGATIFLTYDSEW